MTTRQRLFFAVGILFLALVSLAPVAYVTLHHLNENANVVPSQVATQLVWFYNQPVDGNLSPLVEHFDTFILTHPEEPIRDALQAQGLPGPFLQYLAFSEIVAPETCWEEPWGNQVAYLPGDYCMMSRQHPDWFLRDADGEAISAYLTYGNTAFAMDPGNPGWRAFWLERARQMQEDFGWDGVFLDNVEARLSRLEREYGRLPAAYSDDASYQAAVEGFLEYIYTDYFQSQGRPLYANIIEAEDHDIWFRYLQHLDGAMNESWAIGWSDASYLDAEDWEQDLRLAEMIQRSGKHVILVTQGERENLERQQFAFASYLLVNNGHASFRYMYYVHAYPEPGTGPWLYTNYDLDLGTPRGARYHPFLSRQWRRDFTNGYVLVAPDTQRARFVTR